MRNELQQKINAFREKWSNEELQRPRLGANPTREQKEVGDEIQRRTRERERDDFIATFTNGEIAEIRNHVYEVLQPQVLSVNPKPLRPDHPVHEVDAELMNEYYFFRMLV